MANIPIPTITEIDNLFDEKTFNIYKEGLTSTINQADSDYATGLVKTYCPQNVSEMSAFVAIIRPGCASLLQDFINRKPYTTGVKELDEILIEGKHRMIYQELIMKYLIWLGIPETGSYDIIKKIAKKKFKEAELNDLKQKLLKGWLERVGTEDGFIETWTVVEQAAKYSFNASHSLSYAYDSLYGAYLKSHYPLEYYAVALNYYKDDTARTAKLTEELPYFGIELKPIKFRFSQAEYSISKKDNCIYKGIASIKDLNESVAQTLYELGKNHYDTFIDLLKDIQVAKIDNKKVIKSNQMKILIGLGFFNEFGEANYLKKVYDIFCEFDGKSQLKKSKAEELHIHPDLILPHCGKVTDKTYLNLNSDGFIKSLSNSIRIRPQSLSERIDIEIEYLGNITIKDSKYSGMVVVTELNTKFSPKLELYSLKNGTTITCKVGKKTFNMKKLQKGDVIRISKHKYKPKQQRNEDGSFSFIEGSSELWLEDYSIIERKSN